MGKLAFMSPEHVAHMNALLANDVASKEACAKLDRCWTMVYELSDASRIVWWTMSFDPAQGVAFSLDPPHAAADILYRGDYRSYMEWMRRHKAGEQPGPEPVDVSGDPNGMTVIGPAFQAAGQAATVETEVRIN